MDGVVSCHCGLPAPYTECCGLFIEGDVAAPTAERLMRSRYSAFVEANADYLLATWHPATRPSRVRFDPGQRWLGLSIKSTYAGTESDTEGTVEFVARFKVNGRGHRLHEVSRFEHIEGRWFYRDGDHL